MKVIKNNPNELKMLILEPHELPTQVNDKK